jgi:hypothetical protein
VLARTIRNIYIAMLVLLGLFLTASFGAAYENHRALKFAKAHADDPISIIGVGICKHFIGVIIVSRDGSVHDAPGVSLPAAQEAAATLPEANSTLVNIACGAGDRTI